MSVRQAIAIGAMFLSACGADVTVPASEVVVQLPARDLIPSFQTDSLTYVARAGSAGYEFEIGVAFTNKSPSTAYFLNCAGASEVYLERLVDGNWTKAWSPVMAMCLSQPIVVQPLASVRQTVRVFGGYPDCNCSPRFVSDEPPSGIYRLVWAQLYGSYNSLAQSYSSALPFGMRVSNQFLLTAQPR